MKKFPLLLLGVLAVAAPVFSDTTVATDPVGFVTVTVPAQSDAVLAVPLFRAPVFQGTISSISGLQVTLNASPTLPAGSTYALVLGSGSKEGQVAKVTTQSGATLTLQLDSGDDLTNVATGASGEMVTIMPYWTPSTLFTTAPPTGTEILTFEGVGAGTNLAAPQSYGYTGTTWEDENTFADVTNAPMRFGAGFVLRNNSNAQLAVTMVGSVPMVNHRAKFATISAGVDQDIRFGYTCPVPESLISLQIPAVAGDVLYGYNNAGTGKNKSASQIYAYDGTQWVDDITGAPIDASVKLQPGYGYLFRKYRTNGSPQTVVWQHIQTYLQP